MKTRLETPEDRVAHGHLESAMAKGSPGAKSAAAEVNILSVLSPAEQKELRECEAVITRGWETFLEVGRALQKIRNNHLYRHSFKTFEDYCRDKWQFGRAHAYRLIGAAQVLATLSPIGDKPVPTHESQIRPLLGLELELARAAWMRAVEMANGKTITARVVRNAVEEILMRPPSKERRASRARQRTNTKEALALIAEAQHALQQGKASAEVMGLLQRAQGLLVQP